MTQGTVVVLECVALQVVGMSVLLRSSVRDWAVAGGPAIIVPSGMAIIEHNWLKKALAKAQDVSMAVGVTPARAGLRALSAPVVIGAADSLMVLLRTTLGIPWVFTGMLLGQALWILMRARQVRRWEAMAQVDRLFTVRGGWPARVGYFTRNR
ncbi:MAG: hypothetical protein WCB86_03735 [Candidatus Dormiibacterota bacterium]